MLAAQNDVEIGHGLLERLVASRGQTDRLFDLVKPESLYERPIPERHRIVFYIGHLEAFDWNLFRGRAFDVSPFHPEFDRLFAFGIDPVGGGLPTDQPSDWPSLPEVRNYVGQVRQILDEELSKALASNGASREFPVSLLLNVAIEHRLMHAETLAYMLHQLPVDQKIRPAYTAERLVATAEPRMIEIPAGRTTLGLSRHDPAFGWDNEYELHTVDVPAFSIDQYKVTNAEWLEFMAAGGYDRNDLWTDDNWKWRREHGVSHPAFWKWSGAWSYRTMFDEIPLPLDWPVYVSQAEASAFARWVGKTLPTEAQWHRAAYSTAEGNNDERPFPWGTETPGAKLGNFDFERWDPTPVGAFPQSQSAWGVEDLVGNGWEWTSSVFAPFPGFERFPFYPGYSADFFDGKHHVIKGGSARTAACMLRRSFRNWFQPHYQYVYAGFRCVSNQ
jgi:ergothioneine biosynthesis protein EgtB